MVRTVLRRAQGHVRKILPEGFFARGVASQDFLFARAAPSEQAWIFFSRAPPAGEQAWIFFSRPPPAGEQAWIFLSQAPPAGGWAS